MGDKTQSYEFEVVTVNSSGAIINCRKAQARYYVEDLGGGVGLDMVEIPGGTFMMGSPANEQGRGKDERPQHKATISSFYMGKYEVTQAQWRAVAGLPKVAMDLNPDPSYSRGDDLPVDNVSWDEAVEFCARLSRATGKTYRLPTEAEWEYACRAGTTTPFSFGETITPELVNYNGHFPYGSGVIGANRNGTMPVGSAGYANGFGLYDMHGNVWEWCQDLYSKNYSSQSPSVDSKGQNTETRRVNRGGGWNCSARLCRSAVRSRGAPGDRSIVLGFRLARTYN